MPLGTADTPLGGHEYADLILGPLLLTSKVLPYVRVIQMTTTNLHIPLGKAANVSWVPEHDPIPESNDLVDELVVTPVKAAALATVSNELINDSSPSAREVLGNILVKLCGTSWSQHLQETKDHFASHVRRKLSTECIEWQARSGKVLGEKKSHKPLTGNLGVIVQILGTHDNSLALQAMNADRVPVAVGHDHAIPSSGHEYRAATLSPQDSGVQQSVLVNVVQQ